MGLSSAQTARAAAIVDLLGELEDELLGLVGTTVTSPTMCVDAGGDGAPVARWRALGQARREVSDAIAATPGATF